MDIMYINQFKFLVGTSWYICFGMTNYISNSLYKSVIKVMKKHCSLYTQRRFNITKIYMDSEFQYLKDSLNKEDERFLCTNSKKYLEHSVEPAINLSDHGDHVLEPKCLIGTIKDSVCSIKTGIWHFKKFSHMMIIEMVAAVLLYYNLTILTDEVSTMIPPSLIMTVKTLDMKQDMKH